MELGKVEYRVRPITRYVVTRYHETVGGRTGGTEERGQYENGEVAHEVAYALCRAEHDQLGWPIDDERIQYPRREIPSGAQIGTAGEDKFPLSGMKITRAT